MTLDFKITTIATCLSTNTLLKEELLAGKAKIGDVLLCDKQTQGRGRRDREWISPRGNLAMSVVLPVPLDTQNSHQWGLVVALSLKEALGAFTDAPVAVKWPNDVLINNKKLAGLLSEFVPEKNAIVLGVGLNLNSTGKDFPPFLTDQLATLRDVVGKDIAKNDFVARFLQSLKTNGELFLLKGFSVFQDLLLTTLAWKNQRVRVSDEKNNDEGILSGIDERGFLTLKTDEGKSKTFVAGDLSLRHA